MIASTLSRWGARASRAVAAAYLCALACLLVLGSVPMIWGWWPTLVIGDSMSPSMHKGDLLLMAPVDAEQLRVGQVIVFDRPGEPGQLIVHRLVRRGAAGALVTQGDANAVADSTPVSPTAVRGLTRLVVPKLGLPVLWLREGRYPPLALWAGSTVLASWLVFRTGPRGNRRERSAPTGLANARSTPAAPGQPSAAQPTGR